jgi:hypothetical protein
MQCSAEEENPVTKLFRWSRLAVAALLLVFAFGRAVPAAHADFSGLTITLNITSDDVTSLPADTQLALIGTWTIAFDNNGGYAVGKDNTVTAYGLWQSSGTQITMTDVGGPFACTGDQATGVYNVDSDGTNFGFTTVSDDCQGREFLMTVHRFTLTS